MIRASMGKAVMAMAAPMKSVASSWLVFSAKSPGIFISHGASKAPRAKGTAIPAMETDAALRSLPRNRSIRNSAPTRNMYSPTPSWAPT